MSQQDPKDTPLCDLRTTVYTARAPNHADSSMRRSLPALAGLMFALSSAPALAAADLENGRQLAFTCAGCHGIAEARNAYPNYHVPKIAGQNETFLVNALKAYRNGDRRHPTMEAQSLSLSDQDIADLAAYFAQWKPR